MNSTLIAAAAVGTIVAAGAGFAAGVQWQQGKEALALVDARNKLREQSRAADIAATNHAAAMTKLNLRLGSTRAELYALSSGRDCLSGRAVRLLNNPGLALPAAASEPSRTPEAFATDRDVGDALAICRTGYERLSAQLNNILDIEDTRQRPGGGAAALQSDEAATQPPSAWR